MQILLDTILLRPYVFLFFIVYAVGCSIHLGLKRTALFGIAGYFIAWASEYSSIHTGFPYGLYYYIETTRGQELWIAGVPFMDSISYVFLAYASYSVALLVKSPVLRLNWTIYVLETREIRNSFSVAVLAAILFVYLDIIIDPVALRGDRWFLGSIYGYVDPGLYFGVPVSNFAGWFLVGLLMVSALQRIDACLSRKEVKDYCGYRYAWRYLIGPGLYAGVLGFNLAMTFFIREYTLGWVGIFILILPAVLIYQIQKLKRSLDTKKTVAAHLKDFSGAGPFPNRIRDSRGSIPSPP